MVFNCNLCFEFQAHTLNILLNHIGRCHSSDPNFNILCGIDACARSYGNYRAFRNHISAKHAHFLDDNGNQPSFMDTVFAPNYTTEQHHDDSSNSSSDSDEDEFNPHLLKRQMTKANAYFLLKTKEEGRNTQKCLGKIVSTTSEIVKNSVNVVKAQMVSALENSGLDYKDIQGLEEVFSDESPAMNPFQGISNERSQTQFYKDHFGLVVSAFISDMSNLFLRSMAKLTR